MRNVHKIRTILGEVGLLTNPKINFRVWCWMGIDTSPDVRHRRQQPGRRLQLLASWNAVGSDHTPLDRPVTCVHGVDVTRSWSFLLAALLFTGCLTYGVQEPAPRAPSSAVPTQLAPPSGASSFPSAVVTTQRPDADTRLALSRRSAAWSQLRRTLLAAPEGVSAGQITAIETLLSELRTARRKGTPVPLAKERTLLRSTRDSPLSARPSVAAAIRNIERHLPADDTLSAPSQTPPSGR